VNNPEPKPATGEWTVETNTGSNEMKRIMDGERIVIGWTMRPFSESFQKIADAHNAAVVSQVQQLREQIKELDLPYRRQAQGLQAAKESLERELAAAQAAIIEHNKHVEEMHSETSDDCYEIPITDTTALDAELEKHQSGIARDTAEIMKLRAELATLQEKHGDEMTSVQLQLSKQLAAVEREWEKIIAGHSRTNQAIVDHKNQELQQLRAQLAAAQSEAALAKVGK
jgi:hypothetical protein